jgi:hypothetical protein
MGIVYDKILLFGRLFSTSLHTKKLVFFARDCAIVIIGIAFFNLGKVYLHCEL